MKWSSGYKKIWGGLLAAVFLAFFFFYCLPIAILLFSRATRPTFSERLKAAANLIRQTEKRASQDPEYMAALLANRCRPILPPDQGPCILFGEDKILTASVTRGFFRPHGYYLFKRLGDPAPDLNVPSWLTLQAAKKSEGGVKLDGGWWLEFQVD